jgi:MOSC domain-containing protein YiiM
MARLDVASLVSGRGIEGDSHARPASQRQVLLVDKEALDALDLEPGTIKENLTVEGLHVMGLPAGSRLEIGASVVLEITSVCKPCFRMDEIRAGLRESLEGRRGMNAIVLEGGSIRVGDRVRVAGPSALVS